MRENQTFLYSNLNLLQDITDWQPELQVLITILRLLAISYKAWTSVLFNRLACLLV